MQKSLPYVTSKETAESDALCLGLRPGSVIAAWLGL